VKVKITLLRVSSTFNAGTRRLTTIKRRLLNTDGKLILKAQNQPSNGNLYKSTRDMNPTNVFHSKIDKLNFITVKNFKAIQKATE
jgi:hypothetical protein